MGISGRGEGTTARAYQGRLAATGMLVAFLSLLPVLSCGGSSPAPSTVVPPGVCLDFNAISAPASGTVVASENGATTCDRLVLDLLVTDVDDLFGAEFTLGFNPAALRYDGYDESDSILGSDGTELVVVPHQESGLIQLTIARLRASSGGIDAVGAQLLIQLDFVREADSGTSQLAFSDERLFDSDVPPQEIPGISWHGGSVTIR